MIWIVLRSGKVLQYNNCGQCAVEHGALSLRDARGTYLIARIPMDIVERAEFYKPCRIVKEKKVK